MQFKAEYKSKIGQEFPSDPKEQLMGAIKAVFRSCLLYTSHSSLAGALPGDLQQSPVGEKHLVVR